MLIESLQNRSAEFVGLLGDHHAINGHLGNNGHDLDDDVELAEREYLMTKTAAMHFGQGRDLHGHQGGAGGGVVPGVGANGREVKPHQCQQCLKSFSSNHQLVQHIRVHTGEKPYKCSYCPRRFKQLSHVQQHTRLHTGERPYKCHVLDCGRAFIQLSNLQQHLRNHESQLERLKNRPFHCNICGKGFATESSLRTHTGKADCRCPTWGTGSRHARTQPTGEVPIKQHTTLVGGSNPSCCPLCQKVCISGEDLMEHMKYVHKDPNASGVPAKRRAANHPCPVCGKFYVNEGSLRKHLACHPEMASQLTSSLRMWPCNVCTAVFTHESGLLAHMDQMRMDPKHQFAAQYVLSRAANERREREALLAAAAMNMSHLAMSANVQPLLQQVGSPSGQSDSSTRISTPAELKLERAAGVRSPLSLAAAHHHHQQQQQQQQHQQQQHHQQLMDYGLGRMTSNSMLAMTGSGHLLGNNLENGSARENLRMGSPGANASGADQLLSPTGQSASQVTGSDLRMDNNASPNTRIDQNNDSGYQSLRGTADGSIRAHQNSDSVNLSSPNDDRDAHQQQQRLDTDGCESPRLDEAAFKQAMNSFNQQTQAAAAAVAAGYQVTSGSGSGYTAASELLNRYRLEQTIKQLHGHGFQDPRSSLGLPFSNQQV